MCLARVFCFSRPLALLVGPAVATLAWSGGAVAAVDLITVCPAGAAYGPCDYSSLREAVRKATDGATVLVGPGTYREAAVVSADKVTIRAPDGAHVTGAAAQGKAAFVVAGDDVTIEGIECSDITVPDGNGACVRGEGTNLTLRDVYFRDSEEGFLGGRGRVVIENSRFERLGNSAPGGLAHAIYADTRVDELVLRGNTILASKREGHEVKSRARKTIIEDNVIASLDGQDSRLIDISHGGTTIIRNNVLQSGPNTSNSDVIGLGLERGASPRSDPAVSETVIEGNTIILDGSVGHRLLHSRDMPEPRLRNNVIVGGKENGYGPSNRWIANREEAGLPPYPALPEKTIQ